MLQWQRSTLTNCHQFTLHSCVPPQHICVGTKVSCYSYCNLRNHCNLALFDQCNVFGSLQPHVALVTQFPSVAQLALFTNTRANKGNVLFAFTCAEGKSDPECQAAQRHSCLAIFKANSSQTHVAHICNRG